MIISPDHFLVDADGQYIWTPAGVASAWQATITRVTDLLGDPRYKGVVLLCGLPASGKTTWLKTHAKDDILYVDAVFSLKSRREPFIKLAAEKGKPIEVVFLDTPYEICVARNSQRSEDRQVPPDKMDRFHKDISAELPEISEGFTRVTFVLPLT